MELAHGKNIPSVYPPRTGPPIIPPSPIAASSTPGRYLTAYTKEKQTAPYKTEKALVARREARGEAETPR